MGLLDQPEQQVQQQYQQPINYPIPDGPTDDFFVFRLDSSDIIEELEHQLRGEVFIKGRGYIPKFDKQMTDEGINDILNIVYSFGINKNVILGCLTHEEIYQRCNSIWIEIAKYVVVNGDRVGIDRRKRSLLVKNIVYMVHSALSRSEEGREADQLSTASQRVEHTLREDRPQNKFSPLGFLQRHK